MSEPLARLAFERGGRFDLTTFAGGVKDGVCLQVDVLETAGTGYVQLTHDDVVVLRRVLGRWLIDNFPHLGIDERGS